MVNPIHVSGTPENNAVVPVEILMYYPAGMSSEDILEDVRDTIADSAFMVCAYRLVSNGFGGTRPDDDPIA